MLMASHKLKCHFEIGAIGVTSAENINKNKK